MPKRKRASSPGASATKRPRRSDEEEEDEQSTASFPAMEARSTRRKIMNALVTPVKKHVDDVDVHGGMHIERASVKKQYGRSARKLREQVPRGRSQDNEKDEEDEEIEAKDAGRMKAGVTTPAKHVGRRGRASVGRTRSAAAEENEESQEREEIRLPKNPAGRTPVLTIPKLSSTSATGKKSRRGTWYYETVEPDEDDEPSLPARRSTVLRKSEASADTSSRSNQRTSKHTDIFDGTPTRNNKETPRKAMDAIRRRTRSLASSAPPSDDEEETRTPTKNVKSVRRQSSNFTTPKRSSRLSYLTSSSGVSEAEEDDSLANALRRPTRPRKGRPSYTAKVRGAPGLDLQSDISVVAPEDAITGHAMRSTPVPDTETEFSGTEGNLTPASVTAFAHSSSRVIGEGSDEEMELDEAHKIVLDESILPSQPASPSKHPLSKTLPENFHRFLQPQKMAVLQRLHSPAYIEVAPVTSVDRAIVEAPPLQQLKELLTGTCERGEGNSCLLLGPRGSGKTLLLNAAIDACTSSPIVVRLSGHTQSTDRLAMQEIAYQLNHQTDSVFNIPEEDREEGDGAENEEVDFAPPAAYLPTLISQLTTLKRPVIVVLDAFDLFISHPRQALLYCLLDTAQMCRVGEGRNGLLVIGVSCVVNCLNNLEKRVKSRFSHRILKICNPSTLAEYLEITKSLLNVPLMQENVDCVAKDLAKWNLHWRKCVEYFIGSSQTKGAFIERYAFRRDIGHLCRLLTLVMQDLSTANPWLSNARLLVVSEPSGLPEQYSFMNRLPDTAMWVLVSLIHWETAGHTVVNLRMVLDACSKASMYQDSIRFVVSNAGEARSVTTTAIAPALLQTAYEDLISTRVLQLSASSSAASNQRFEFVKYKPMVDRETLRRVVEKNGSTAVKNWLKNASVLNA